MAVESILWQRLDSPGHDACIINQNATGWKLSGSAVFLHDGNPAMLAYKVVCDADWRTLYGQVEGWLGKRQVTFRIARTKADSWQLNDFVVPNLETCIDLDLGFTPATNLMPLRRLDLAEGQAADVPAAWLNVRSRSFVNTTPADQRRPIGTKHR